MQFPRFVRAASDINGILVRHPGQDEACRRQELEMLRRFAVEPGLIMSRESNRGTGILPVAPGIDVCPRPQISWDARARRIGLFSVRPNRPGQDAPCQRPVGIRLRRVGSQHTLK